MATVDQPVAVAEGEGSVAIAAPVRGAMIVTGDNNTVEMRLTGVGGVLAFAFRWNRPRRRRRADRGFCPPRFDNHVDRDDQVAALLPIDGSPRAVNVYGAAGIGKTHVLIEALNRGESDMRDGSVYLDGRGASADDLLHAVFDELYECRVQRRDLRIERLLSSRRALVALENVELAPGDAQRLMLGAPRCRLLVTSRSRMLLDATPVSLAGLAPEYAVEIAEQELGRSLGPQERWAAESIAASLEGHPLQLRQAFSRARDEGRGRPLDELEPWLASGATHSERLDALTAAQLRAARALAVHGDAPLGDEHLGAIAGAEAVTAVAELEARHDARSHSPRHSLVGALARVLAQEDLAEETDRALEHFTWWAEVHAGDSDTIMREAAALLALLERAHAADRWPDVIRLGRAIEGAYALGQRWAAWGHVIGLVLEAARRLEDLEAEAWARHQLGTRSYGMGEIEAARTSLQAALALRERIGDGAGAAATRQNLAVVSGRAPLLYRLSHLPLVVVTAVCALLIGAGGLAGAQVVAGGGEREPTGPALVVAVVGQGLVVSDDGSIRCRERQCRAERPRASELQLRARPQRGWELARWSGACSGRGTCRLLLTADTGVVALFKAVREPREVTVRVRGKGTVVSHPAGIACEADEDCEATFTRSRDLRLTAAAALGHRFAGWSRDCEGAERCVISGDGRRTVVHARFVADPATVALTVDVRGDGLGHVTSRESGIDCGERCAASFRRGTRVLLVAAAQPGSDFAGWSDRACAPQAAASCDVSLDRSRDVFARFARVQPVPSPVDLGLGGAPDPVEGVPGIEHPPPVAPVSQPRESPPLPALTVTTTGTGSGTVTSTPTGIDCGTICRAPFALGQRVRLTAVAINSDFKGWSGAGCSGTGACVVRLDREQALTASFQRHPPPKRTLTVIATGKGRGIVTSKPRGIACGATCDAPFGHGQKVTLTATGIDSVFEGWSGAGCAGVDTCVVTLGRAEAVVARFEPSPPPRHILTVDLYGAGVGSVTSRPAGIRCETAVRGSDIREYSQARGTAGGGVAGAAVDAPRSCEAAFDQGEKVTLIADPGIDSMFGGWSPAGCRRTRQCDVTIDGAQWVKARFEPSPPPPPPPPPPQLRLN